MGVEVGIHEGGLDETLAVVEDTIDFDGGDVLPQGGELTFLDGRHLTLGIEDIDVDALDAEEAVGNGGASVARGGYEDVHGPSPGPFPDPSPVREGGLGVLEGGLAGCRSILIPLPNRGGVRGGAGGAFILQQPRHEAGTDVLEGEGGAMEEFEGVDVVLDANDGGVEGEGVIDDATEVVGRNVLAEEGIGNAVGNLLESEVSYLVPEGGGELLDDFGHIEATVFGEAADYSFAECSAGGGVVGGVIEHKKKKAPPPPPPLLGRGDWLLWRGDGRLCGLLEVRNMMFNNR